MKLSCSHINCRWTCDPLSHKTPPKSHTDGRAPQQALPWDAFEDTGQHGMGGNHNKISISVGRAILGQEAFQKTQNLIYSTNRIHF